ncbi:DUF7350 domain-containing protein [Halobacterium zhouii]|uniref:DUF7350 domain-containing protein n=1 Tax=Halobacterium zhouii TaxID=2902624 RepID=UPI001E463A6A|nr:hypothetical protein [Halobacterium zhouii]
MRRREFLAATGVTGLAASAGCAGLLETQRANVEPPLPANRPNAVYLPSHTEGMKMVGTQSKGRYRCALSYTFPHRFWLVTREETQRVDVAGDLHLMTSVWDAEAGALVPDASPQIELVGPDDKPRSFVPWQMLSQPMGVHHGDNVGLGPEGTYDVTVKAAPSSTRRTTASAASGGPIEFSFSMDYRRSALEELSFTDVPSNREGTKGAVDPMGMKPVQLSQVPAAASFPMSVRGTGTTGDADVVVASADERGELATGSDESYLVASLRTPYNRFALPAASLSATVTRNGETRHSGPLVATLDSELGYHYAAAVPSLGDADEVTVTVDAPPQLTRHEGYETAFFGMDSVTV